MGFLRFVGNNSTSTTTTTDQVMRMMPCSENTMPIDSMRNLDAADASFCWDSMAFSDYNYQLDPPLHHQPSFFSSYDHQQFSAAGSEYVPFSSGYDTVSSQSSPVLPLVANPHVNLGLNSRQQVMRKRPSEVSSMAMKGTGKRKKSSPNAISADVGALHQYEQMNRPSITLQEIKGAQMPVRRSQKMSDKITALQKLVSPYGKTDTASVLEEASLCIKLLHNHIQMLSHCAASNDSQHTEAWMTTTTFDESDGELMGLRRRGLCLVPLSVTKKIADQCLVVDPSSYPEE